MIERSLVILKPDAVVRGLSGQIMARFERAGLSIVAAKLVRASEDVLKRHYPLERKEFVVGMGQKALADNKELGVDTKKVFGTDDAYKLGLKINRWLIDYMQSSPVFVLVVSGPGAIALVRKLRGPTLPSQAPPGTIGGDFSFDSAALANSHHRPVYNMVHASGNPEEADYEVKLWFKESELHDYRPVHQDYMIKGHHKLP